MSRAELLQPKLERGTRKWINGFKGATGKGLWRSFTHSDSVQPDTKPTLLEKATKPETVCWLFAAIINNVLAFDTVFVYMDLSKDSVLSFGIDVHNPALAGAINIQSRRELLPRPHWYDPPTSNAWQLIESVLKCSSKSYLICCRHRWTVLCGLYQIIERVWLTFDAKVSTSFFCSRSGLDIVRACYISGFAYGSAGFVLCIGFKSSAFGVPQNMEQNGSR